MVSLLQPPVNLEISLVFLQNNDFWKNQLYDKKPFILKIVELILTEKDYKYVQNWSNSPDWI